MAEKKKSIIEEALLEAKTLEDALKANTKEMLSAHMSKEIESIVESSLREQDEETIELDDIELKGSADDMDVELELDNEDDDSEESEELGMEVMDLPDDGEEVADIELDLDTDLDLDLDGGEELELDLEPMGMELGMDDVLDMTMSSDDEVVTVFKKLGPDDEVEVVKDADGIHLTDNETGAEYYIKESLEEMEMMDEDDEMCEGCGMDEDEIVYEIEMDEELGEGHQSFSDRRSERRGMRKHYGENPDGLDAHLSHSKQGYNDRMDDSLGMDEDYGMDEEEVMDEDHTLARTKGYQRKGGHRNRQTSETRNSRKPVITRKPKTNTVAESKMLKEYNELKGKNTEYKKALNIFKDKLNEVALFNTNLAYVNRLFTENSTTKKEKMLILKRFDNADTIKESKSIYKTIKTELDAKTPISESVENKVNKTVKSSKSDLNESTAYVDPQISAIKDLMKRIS
tara:strand:- start:1201 stop:2574 length:1374 start_codon:yes stop_codon:yes gene_type:complete